MKLDSEQRTNGNSNNNERLEKDEIPNKTSIMLSTAQATIPFPITATIPAKMRTMMTMMTRAAAAAVYSAGQRCVA